MSFTAVVYLLLLALIAWGGRFAGIHSYHEDFLSVDSMKALRGLSAILIFLHHISLEQALMKTGQLQFFYNSGPFLVSVFFFSSGYGLIKSMKSKPDYFDRFLEKRVLLVLVLPFFVNELLYGIYHLICGKQIILSKLIFSLLGLNLINEYAWYPIVLAILYLAFYLIFKNIKNRKAGFLLIFLLILAQGYLFAVRGHVAWWAGKNNWWLSSGAMSRAPWWKQEKALWFHGQWWVNSSIGFLVGMLVSEYEQKLIPWLKKNYWIKFLFFLILALAFHKLSLSTQAKIGYYTEYSGKGPGIGDKFITYLSQLPEITFFLLALFIGRMKLKLGNPVTSFFGKYSLHTYLMNLMALEICKPILYKNGQAILRPWNSNQAVFAVAVIVLSVLLALLEYAVVTMLQRKLAGRKQNVPNEHT